MRSQYGNFIGGKWVAPIHRKYFADHSPINGIDAYRLGRGIKAGRVLTNRITFIPLAFGGFKRSGFGRETNKMMLDHYQQTKNLLVSYSPKALGLF